MSIRHYKPDDEIAQAEIFNAAAASLPNFKPATVIEIQRRIRVRDFDPTTRFFAEEGGRVVGYGVVQSNGRISYPWCLDGFDHLRGPLLDAMLNRLRQSNVWTAFAAYRADWSPVNDFLVRHGFSVAREVVNFFINFHDMPTPSFVQTALITKVEPADIPAIFELGAGTIQARDVNELEKHLLKNPYFPPESVFVLRSKVDRRILAASVLVIDASYADPRKIDSAMPCFRLGAFGTEGMTSKRVNGLFSFIAANDRSATSHALELMGEASSRVRDGDPIEGFAAQALSDSPVTVGFYQKFFRRQGSFPILERSLAIDAT